MSEISRTELFLGFLKIGLLGYTSTLPQGFAATHGPNFEPEKALAAPPREWHVLSNLFKYHASCYETHATIECALALREAHGIKAANVKAVEAAVNPYCDRICNIVAPVSGLEAKFSLRGPDISAAEQAPSTS